MTLATVTADNHAEWLEARRLGIGGSDAAAVLGVSPFDGATPLGVYLHKVGLADPVESNEAMMWGHLMEPLIAEAYAERFDCGFIGEQVFARATIRPFLFATLDRIRSDNRITEFKNVGRRMADAWGPDESQEVPIYVAAQAQHQMLVRKADVIDVAALICGQELRVYTLERDDRVHSKMLDAYDEFWDRVERRDPPPASQPSDADLMHRLYRREVGEVELSAEMAEAVTRYQELGREIREMEDLRKGYKCGILESLKEASSGYLPDGRIITRKIIELGEQTITRKAYTYVDLRVKKGRVFA